MRLQHEIQVVLRRRINKRCNLLITFKQHRCTAAVSLNPQPSPPHNPDICTAKPRMHRSIFTSTWTLHTSLWLSINISPPSVALFLHVLSQVANKVVFFLVQFHSSWLLEFVSFDSACQKLWFIDRNACDNRGKRETGTPLRASPLLLENVKSHVIPSMWLES